MTPDIYICDCGQEANVPTGNGLPAGWISKQVRGVMGPRTVVMCTACSEFEDILVPTSFDGDRTHDNSSAINDEELRPIPRCTGKALPLWQISLIFNSEKGAVESTVIVRAENPIVAMNVVELIDRFRMAELVSIVVTPAPLVAPLVAVTMPDRIAA